MLTEARMKKYILLVVVAVLIFIVVVAIPKPNKKIGDFVVGQTATIYKIAARSEDGSVANYWWVDEWGRPVNFKEYAPSKQLGTFDIINEFKASFK